jgi:hypothetical protein
VVKLATVGDRGGRSRRSASRKRPRSKIALVLGGGGFTGGVYEIRALRAPDLLSVNRTANQFDVYVGTSAGAFVAAAVASGVSPDEMMRVKGRELVDGGIVSTTNLDIAVEAGAKFVVVVNPLMPYVNDFKKRIPTITGSRARHVSDMGFAQIAYQALKLLAYQRLHEVAADREQRYPGVDIILIEPEPNDELMFQTSILNHTSRGHSAARVPVCGAQARGRLPALQADLRPSRNQDLRDPGAKGDRPFRRRAREDPSLAEDPGADDLDAAASVSSGLEAPMTHIGLRAAGVSMNSRPVAGAAARRCAAPR